MNEREIFAQLLRYFPEGEDKKMFSNMRLYSEACLAVGEFMEAENYADKLLAQDCGEVCLISARKTKLFCKLQCRSNEEFRHCAQFTKEMPEYCDLLVACAENEKKLSEFIKLAESNLQTVENDRLKREEAEKKRLEEAEREKRAAKEKAKKEAEQRAERAIEMIANTIFIVIFLILPLILVCLQIYLMANSGMDKTLANGLMALCCLPTCLLTGFVARVLSNRMDEAGAILSAVDYVIMGISILLILIVYSSSCEG